MASWGDQIWKRAQAKLQEVQDLAGEKSDAHFMANTSEPEHTSKTQLVNESQSDDEKKGKYHTSELNTSVNQAALSADTKSLKFVETTKSDEEFQLRNSFKAMQQQWEQKELTILDVLLKLQAAEDTRENIARDHDEVCAQLKALRSKTKVFREKYSTEKNRIRKAY